MTDNHNFLALDWVKSEIEETLKQAQQALEAYIVTPSDTAKLRFCLAYLHQVFGTLQMVEFYGAAMLAEEMEKLCLSLVNHKVTHRERAHHALIEAMLQLPAYLERLQVAKKDTPFVLLPVINELRMAHDENPISELALFKPDFARVFSVLGQAGISPSSDALKKLRHGYQLSLLGIIRQQNLIEQYEHLILVFEKLGLFMGQKPLQALWRTSSALVEGLMANDVPLTPAIKTLLGEIEQELRKYIAYPQHSPSLEMLKNILYYIAKSRGNTHRVLAMRALYHLDDILPTFDVVEAEKEKLNAPDRQAMKSVIKGVTDELVNVKDVIDDLTYATHPNIESLQPLLPVLRQVASTLQVLGLHQLQRIISDQVKTLNKSINFGVLPEGALLVVASGLIEVECSLQQLVEDQPLSSSLDTFGGSAMVDQVSAAQGAVLRESRTALEKAKESIVEYISSQWHAEKLIELPTLLNTVRGGLAMLDLSRPAQILGRLSEFVQQHLLKDDYRPSWSEMDTLADIISSVEYYLERVANHHQNNSLLDVAAQSLDKLGYGLVLAAAPVEQVERRTMAKTEEERALPEIEFGEPPPSKLDATLLNIPALNLPDVSDVRIISDVIDEPSQDFDKTQISMPALSDEMLAGYVNLESDVDKTQISMPALSDEMLSAHVSSDSDVDKTQINIPAIKIDIVPDNIGKRSDSDDDAFSSTMTFNAEDYFPNISPAKANSSLTEDAPVETVSFEGTESIFKPEGATLVAMPVVNEADITQSNDITEKNTDDLHADTMEGVSAILDESIDLDATIKLDAMVKLDVDSEESVDAAIESVIAETVVATDAFELTATMPQDDITDDDDICEIFAEEVEEVLETIQTFLPKWSANFENKSALTEVRRGFHTLKGSGRMVGAKVVGELGWSIENMLNRVIDKTATPNAVMMQLINAVLDVVPLLMGDFQNKATPSVKTIALMSAADLFAKGQTLDKAQIDWAVAYTHNQSSTVLDVVEPLVQSEQPAVKEEEALDLDNVTIPVMAAIQIEDSKDDFDDVEQDVNAIGFGDFEDEIFDVPMDLGEEANFESTAELSTNEVAVLAESMVPLAEPVTQMVATAVVDVPQHIAIPEDDFSQDDEIREIFIEEVEEVLETIHEYYPKWVANYSNSAALTEFRRGFHTLKGSGRMVGAKVEAELAWSIENMLNRVIDKTAKPSVEMTTLISHVITLVPELITNFQNREKPTLNTSPLMSIADYLARAKAVSMAEVEAAIACAHGQEIGVSEQAHEALVDQDDILDAVSGDSESEEDLTSAFDSLAASLADIEPEEAVTPEVSSTESASAVSYDPVLLDIFVTEANSYLDEIAQYIADLPAQYKVLPVTDIMLRALHTLRGSAGMAGIKTIARLSAPMEQLFKDLRVQNRGLHPKHIDLLAETRRLIGLSLEDVQQGGSGYLEETEAFLARVTEVSQAPASEDDDFVASAIPVNTAGLVAGFLDLGLDHLMDAPWELSGWLASDDKQTHIQTLLQELTLLEPAAKASQITPLSDVVSQLAVVYQFIVEDIEKVLSNEQLLEDLANAHDEIINIFDTLAACQTVQPNPKLLVRLQEWGGSPVQLSTASLPSYEPVEAEIDDGADAELLEIFLEEAEEVLTAADEELATWKNNTEDKQPLRVLQRHLHTLKGGARMAVVASLGDLGHELEFLYEDLVNNRYQATQVLIDFLQRCHDRLAQMIDDLQKEGRCKYAKDLVQLIDEYRRKPSDNVILDFFSSAAGGSNKKEVIPVAVPVAQSIVEQPVQMLSAQEPIVSVATVKITVTDEELDPEMLSIFLEEAEEIVDETNASLQQWMQNAEDVSPVQILQRGLHTLKGGARMSGVNSLGDLSHEMENIYEGVCLKRYQGNADVFALLQRCHDRIADIVDSLKNQGKSLVVEDLVVQLKRYLSNPQQFKDIVATVAPKVTVAAAPAPVAIEEDVPLLPVVADGVMPKMTGNFRDVAKSQQAQEMIRVSSELMEKLINIAGETSIVRSRVEMGVHSFGQTVEEMGSTVQRLAEQLRRMQGELEAQIIAQHTTEDTKYADFDPLEMDQYSSVNQLSKSLYESASDLMDIKGTLIEKARDTETLLLQQARLNTEMQEGLMSSRLVPFSRLVPRLQRIVRQTATELHKPAELYVINADGEMDRTLLERIVAPLEHMLRNAVDHGLENPADRAAAGKEPMGRISLTLGREGGEIVLTLADDGRGVNIEAVRKKAIERGLLEEGSTISEKELLQYLFHAGFSTAQKVTQISGRGVGMDVVQSEIKQLGGTVVIQSVAGKGTTFVMRLPFTVAVSRALMVRIGEDVYAIPLSQIEGIVRANPYELETYYAPNGPAFEYANTTYKLHYLGEFVHGVRVPSLFGQTLPLPIMLIRGAEQRVAIQVDQLIGSREIVVKSVGAQLASVAGISGATILGDGSVVIILDTIAMLRAAALQRPRQRQVIEDKVAAKPERTSRMVMVVDDSVTVRKVTSRLLERHGYEVVLAKDGLDAITKLEDIRPDIMLLDIEMPRMDGFEVASLVRHNPNLVGLPIIMITSRTGEKHRERAFQIGVNAYMGKPFQEQQLLETIAELLAATVK
jgi:chemosensory pili system protein ChpA (sensor histidine kinase/response regulator)